MLGIAVIGKLPDRQIDHVGPSENVLHCTIKLHHKLIPLKINLPVENRTNVRYPYGEIISLQPVDVKSFLRPATTY